MPFKRFERGPVEFLTSEETNALLNAPDATTWLGRRDQLLLQVAVQTGLRNSELTKLRRQDVQLGAGAHVRCLGKGRKARCTPLRSDVAARLSQWLAEQPPDPTTPVFPTARGSAMSSDAFQRLVARHIKTAGKTCPSLQKKRVTPHTLRHTTAMDLLHRGVDITVIALWLGARVNSDHPNLSPCRHGDEGEGSGASNEKQSGPQTLSSNGSAARLPGEPVIMPRVGTR